MNFFLFPLMFQTILMTSTVCDEDNKPFKLTKFYDKSVIPKQTKEEPLDMIAEINLRNILEVDEATMTITIETTLMFTWTDDRVTTNTSMLNKYGFVVLGQEHAQCLWIPDIIIDKAKEIRSPYYIIPTESTRLYDKGKIKYSARKNYDLACGMDFRKFPHDTQECEVIIHSFGSSTKDFTLHWDNHTHAKTINPMIDLPQFSHDVEINDNWDLTDYDIKAYPGLILKLQLARYVTYYVLQLYMPSVFFVALAWATMYLPTTTPGIRAQYNCQITNLITMWTMNNGIHTTIPKTSYLTYADYWLQGCFTFCFVIIAELVLYCAIKNSKNVKILQLADGLNSVSRNSVPPIFVCFVFVYALVIHEVV